MHLRLPLALLLSVACTVDRDLLTDALVTAGPDGDDESSGDASTGAPSTTAPEDPTSTSLDSSSSTVPDDETGETGEEWPLCAPPELFGLFFQVGDDDPYSPDIWPQVRQASARCLVDAVATAEQGPALWQTAVTLGDCVDDEEQPVARSLDVVFSTAAEEPAPALTPGLAVRVAYAANFEYYATWDAWYSLRADDGGDLLLALFADTGPTVAPKLPGEPAPLDWLAPYTAELGPFACPVDESGCSDQQEQRAVVTFARGDDVREVVGGTSAQLGEHRLHLGFAGTPQACEGILGNSPIEGALVRQ